MNRDELEAAAHKAYFSDPVPISDDDAFDVIDLMASFAAAQIQANRKKLAMDIWMAHEKDCQKPTYDICRMCDFIEKLEKENE